LRGEAFTVFLLWKPEVKRLLGRHRRRCEENIKMNLQEVGCVVIDWIKLAKDTDILRALLNAVLNIRIP
jgi:hypothetical protein